MCTASKGRVGSPARPFLFGRHHEHRRVRLRCARRLRRRDPRRLRRSSPASPRAVADTKGNASASCCASASRHPPVHSCVPSYRRSRSPAPRRVGQCLRAVVDTAALRRAHDDIAADDADAGDSEADDDGEDDDAVRGADDVDQCDNHYVQVGRAASRPGFPFQSPLRSDFLCNPSRLRSLTLTARSACPAARYAPRRVPVDTAGTSFDGTGRVTAASSSRRRCAPRSSRNSPRSPWPAAPASGFASARRRRTSCVAGAGFAAHLAPHCAVHRCPHKCGHLRPSLRQRAAHFCLRLRPHCPPLKRRGGSLPPASPTSIPPALIPQIGRSGPPGRPWVSHPTQLAAGPAMGIHVRALQRLSPPSGAWRLLDRACNAPNSSAFRLLSPHACPRR